MASLRQQIATTALTLTKFRELMKRIQENRPQDDLSIVKKAYDYSLKNHEGQTRASGEPYLVHPLEVALVLDNTQSMADSLSAQPVSKLDALKAASNQLIDILLGTSGTPPANVWLGIVPFTQAVIREKAEKLGGEVSVFCDVVEVLDTRQNRIAGLVLLEVFDEFLLVRLRCLGRSGHQWHEPEHGGHRQAAHLL